MFQEISGLVGNVPKKAHKIKHRKTLGLYTLSAWILTAA